MAKDGYAGRPDFAQPCASGERWRTLETQYIEIAPRRSAVRARLAPWRKGPQMRAFRFPHRRRNLWITRPSQVLVKSLGVGPRIERFHRTQEVGGSSPPSSMEERPAKSGLSFSTEATEAVENRPWSSFGQDCAIEPAAVAGRSGWLRRGSTVRVRQRALQKPRLEALNST
jgi:hypothetical protein